MWLVRQHDREDHVGEFARGLDTGSFAEKSARRKHNEHASWVDVVLAMRQPEYVTSFNYAWQEFLVEKELEEAREAEPNEGEGELGCQHKRN